MSKDEKVPAVTTCKKERKTLASILEAADIKTDGTRPFDLTIINNGFYHRVLAQGSLGLGESYMDGWWECERLDIFFEKLLRARLHQSVKPNLGECLNILKARLFNLQSRRKAREVGKKHYDLGNDLFKNMLDPFMQYSCGYWKDSSSLNEAQEAKLELVCKKLALKPGLRLLDIGCGWGGLAEYVSRRYGVSVVGVTIAAEQEKMARERTKDLDVEIRLQDYRDIREKFDRVVSVGMFEHVGPKNYTTFFNVARRCLNEDGLFLLHTIGKNKSTGTTDPWINRYIFPNGALPSVRQIAIAMEPFFVMEDWHNFGVDYDKTLLCWLDNFKKSWPVVKQDYDERFYRMFTYYLQCCAGGFRSRELQLWQVLLSPCGIAGGVRVAR